MFKAIVIDKPDEQYTCDFASLDDSSFPEGNVVVEVEYSSLNYKDGLAVTGASPVVRRFPMIPGIDFAGTVSSSEDANWKVGDKVFINGWGLGEKHWGGLTQKAKVNGDWLLSVPEGLSSFDVMAVGTAGYTAMLSVLALLKHGIEPNDGPVLVTGANGGVGSYAIAFLAKLGFDVVASTGRLEESDRLKTLGAKEVIDRRELSEKGRPLAKETWSAAIDSAGSYTLANVCAGIKYGGTVAACGLAQGMDFPATVAPFILRGVTLVGIDSVMCPNAQRVEAWHKIAELLDQEMIKNIATTIPFTDAIETAKGFIEGKVKGRIVVELPKL
ncbi:oxidoreductase [Vibrio sp.]|uniref:Oxidoreductase n=1 Tax=Vibrio viridaestus TaxID=2487322 RepID=A0A3N9TKY3_9VIBR|nr:MDR family oxidoreductase [Vibrio viridaestus]MDC0612667.1 oxidoreductase [Vibrio sp.]RQW64937.1 oxidoreductase [Vibrio viridaestus]